MIADSSSDLPGLNLELFEMAREAAIAGRLSASLEEMLAMRTPTSGNTPFLQCCGTGQVDVAQAPHHNESALLPNRAFGSQPALKID